MYGSLRRIENGQDRIRDRVDDIFKAVNNIEMDKKTAAKVVAEVRRGNSEPLKEELRKRGVSREDTQEYCELSATYLMASKPERTRIERSSRDSTRTSSGPGAHSSARDNSFRPYRDDTERYWWRDGDYQQDPNTDAPRRENDDPRTNPLHPLHNLYASPQSTRFDTMFESSQAIDPFLGLSQLNPRGRRVSYHGQERAPENKTRETGDTSRSSSSTRHHHRSISRGSREPGSHSRHSSTHSHHRRRRSADADALDAEARGIRMVHKMDRIDSMDPPDTGSERR